MSQPIKNGRDDWTVNKSFLSTKLSASSGFQIVTGGQWKPPSMF